MLAYFPKVYPDELLYSVLARYHRHVGAPSPSHTLEELFGNRHVTATFDLPGHLQSLADQIPSDRGLSVDCIIDNLTLFPYFTAFEPPTVKAKARSLMRNGDIDGLHVRLGLSAFRIGRHPQLRFCPDCVLEMKGEHGELWWRRVDQLPSVQVCPEHGGLLMDSTVSFSQISRHVFIAATSKNCPLRSRPMAQMTDQACKAHLWRIAQRSAELLHRPIAARTLSNWTAFYRNQMLNAGLAKSIRSMDQLRLVDDFRNFYGNALEKLPAIIVNNRMAGDWLASMVRKHRKANHPLYHLLIQDFLAQRELSESKSPFGVGPWPCANPLATHDSKTPIKGFTQHRNRGNTVGVFTCTCGYVYTRCFDSSKCSLGLPRFLSYGPLLEPALRELVRAGSGLRAVGRYLHLDPKTVVRLAIQLGIENTWQRPLRKKGKHPVATAIVQTPVVPMQQTIRVETVPRKLQRRPRYDWVEIDRGWVAKLNAWVIVVLEEIPPVRITIAELERRIGKRDWLLKRRQRLPSTMEFLGQVVETTEDFQLRRVHWVIAELERRGDQVRAWQVMRAAGLRSDKMGAIKAIIEATPTYSKIAA